MLLKFENWNFVNLDVVSYIECVEGKRYLFVWSLDSENYILLTWEEEILKELDTLITDAMKNKENIIAPSWIKVERK